VAANLVRKLGFMVALTAFLVTPSAYPQQPSSRPGGLLKARIKCISEPDVTLTADRERALPLQVVAKAGCNDLVTIVSDPDGYTVRVVTADGKVGYVTRYELVILPQTNPTESSSRPEPAEQTRPVSPGKSAWEEKTASKPRVFITDSESWAEMGGFGKSTNWVPGYNPEMGEIYQNFTSGCPAIALVQDKSNADYAILFDQGSPKKGLSGLGGLVKVNKVTVLWRNTETVLSESAHSEDTVVKLACHAITQRSAATARAQPAAVHEH
jgi:hypothetical protein